MQKMNKFVEKKNVGGGDRLKITFCFGEGLCTLYMPCHPFEFSIKYV